MDFNKINSDNSFGINFSASNKNNKGQKKEIDPSSSSFSELPNNPEYWQNTANISFSGKKDLKLTSDMLNDEIKTLIDSKLLTEDEIKSFMSVLDKPYIVDDKEKELKYVYLIFQTLNKSPEKTAYFKNLTSDKISDGVILPSYIFQLLLEDDKQSKYKFDALDFFINSPSSTSVPPIRTTDELKDFFSMLDETSLEGLKKFSKQINEGGTYLYYKMKNSINPVTGLFDKNIIDLVFELQKAMPQIFGYNYDISSASVIASKAIDKDGKINPLAKEFIDKFITKKTPISPKENLPFSKAEALFDRNKKLMNDSFDSPFYKSYYYAMLTGAMLDLMKDNEGNFNKENIEFLSRLSKTGMRPKPVSPDGFLDSINALKDENGVIDKKKEKIFYQLYDPRYEQDSIGIFRLQKDGTYILPEIMKAYDSIPEKIRDDVFKKTTELFGAKKEDRINGIRLFPKLHNVCFDKNGKTNTENCNLVKRLNKNMITASLLGDKSLLEALKAYSENEEVNILNLSFAQKVHLMFLFEKIRPELNPVLDSSLLSKMTKTSTLIESSLKDEDISLPVSKESRDKFITQVISSNKKTDNGLSEFENTIKDSIPKLKEMNEGLPLKYARDKFLSDLSMYALNDDKLKHLEELLGVNFQYTNEKGRITISGFDGVIRLDKLNRNDEFENSIYEICHKFFYENKINTGDKKLDEALNTIIKAAPEFINTIGKKQHGTHNYTLDIHQLLVLANSINNPDYQKLNDTDKAMLKSAAIFHDIAKKEDTIDKGHQIPSSLYARNIISKFYKNPESLDRVFELIKNHHWLEEYNTTSDISASSKDLAYRFRRPNDFEIAKIMARADLMAVSDEFYAAHKNALDDYKLNEINNRLNQIYQTGSLIMSDYFIGRNYSNLEDVNIKGRNFKVLDFHKIKDDEDLIKYGFAKGRTKKDVQFLVHMVSKDNIKNDLSVLENITSSVNGGVLSESLITPYYKRTYQDRKFGVLLSQINANLINTSNTNQGSGNKKDVNNAIDLLFNSYASDTRTSFRENFLKNLSLGPDEVSIEEYGKFYKDNLVSKTLITQFPDNKTYQLGKRTFSGSDIKRAIVEFQNSLIDKTESTHNEIIGFAPKINAVIIKADNIKEAPDELLDFAHKDNLPVILI